MAKTSFSTSDALTKKLWEEKLYRDTVKASYFSKFMGESSDSLVQVTTKLDKGQGDQVYFGIRMRLSAPGVNENQTLEGNEERLTTYSYSLTLKEYAHAVRDAGPLDRKRAMFSIDDESEMALKDWMQEKIDSLCFDAIVGTSSAPTKIFYKTSAGVLATGTENTAKTALTAADGKLTPAMISVLRTWAETGGNRAYTPLRPVKVDGKKYYVLLCHPDALYDLTVDSTFAQARREAEVRGKENPIFSGAFAIWDGVVVHSHENCPIATDGGGASVAWTRAALMGAQALCWGFGAKPKVVDEEFDYGREHGYAISMLARTAKPVFNSKDYGSMGIFLARTNISGL